MIDGLPPCPKREAGTPCQLQCDICSSPVFPLSEPEKEIMRGELSLLLHCVAKMFEHLQLNRDKDDFRDMLVNTFFDVRDAISTFDKQIRKEQTEK